MIFLTYVPLNFLYELAFPRKETKKMDLNLDDQEAEASMEEAARAVAKAEALEGQKPDEENESPINEDNESKASAKMESNHE